MCFIMRLGFKKKVAAIGIFLLVCMSLFIISEATAQEMSRERLLKMVEEERWDDLPEKIVSPVDGSEMVLVPGGEFLMGVEEDSPLASVLTDAVPQHTVYLDPFYIDKYEITNSQYSEYVEEEGAKNPLFSGDSEYNSPDQPVVGIRYGDAVSYAFWAGKRLPTEAEWEKAARGTDARKYPWGNEFDKDKCNAYPSRIHAPVEVGRYPEGASPYGVMNMAGNVAEWVFDAYENDYYAKSPYKNPKGVKGSGTSRIIRGGDYKSDPEKVTCMSRFQAGAYSAFPNIGFRCAVSAEDLNILFNPDLAEEKQEAVASGVTVITKKGAESNVISDPESNRFYRGSRDRTFKSVRYFVNMGFENYRCAGVNEINKSRRRGRPHWKVYYDSPGKITQARFYDKHGEIRFHIEPYYDSKGREKEVRLFNDKGKMVYRSERVFENDKPVKGILYSSTGDYFGEEKF